MGVASSTVKSTNSKATAVPVTAAMGVGAPVVNTVTAVNSAQVAATNAVHAANVAQNAAKNANAAAQAANVAAQNVAAQNASRSPNMAGGRRRTRRSRSLKSRTRRHR
jgi:hypothetical protein